MKGLIAVLVLVAVPLSASEKADRIFVNGKVWTGEDKQPRAEAVAVRANTILAVGKSSDIRSLAEKGTEVVDLKGRYLGPGFIDAHLHLVPGSLAMAEVDLDGASTLAEVQRRIAAYARANPERKWITGRGWAYSAFPGGLPVRAQLDAVLADRPAFLVSYDGHAGWANSAAVTAARLTGISADPPDGVIVRDASGEPTGVFKERAQWLVSRVIPPPAPEERERALKKGLEQLASRGLTGVHDAHLEPEDLPLLETIETQRMLKVRVYAALPMVRNPGPDVLGRYAALRAKYAGPKLRVGAVKAIVDGVVEAHTAALFEPYPGGGDGLLLWSAEDLLHAVSLFEKENLQIFAHAIGDRAIDLVLKTFEKSGGGTARRHRIEHVEVPRLADLARFKAQGVVASTQALFAEPDQNHLEVYVPTLGPRASRAMPFKAIDDAGIVQAFGSDWPVYSTDVLRAIHCAVTRTTPQGTPAGGWEPAQRITAAAALRHFTRDAAYASFDESSRGTLAPGKLADLVVLSDDPTVVPPEQMGAIKVLLTVMGGQDTYRARGF